jgi:hypothetical protein
MRIECWIEFRALLGLTLDLPEAEDMGIVIRFCHRRIASKKVKKIKTKSEVWGGPVPCLDRVYELSRSESIVSMERPYPAVCTNYSEGAFASRKEAVLRNPKKYVDEVLGYYRPILESLGWPVTYLGHFTPTSPWVER